jgi:CDP-diacylglycerol--glycerol-3-phosphate 3-phosphatidyltransferase
MYREANESAEQMPRPVKKSLTDLAHEWMAILFAPLARLLQRWHVTPNMITVLGSALGLGGGIALALGKWSVAVGLLVVSGFLDGVDGLLARYSQQTSRFGAFLDSVLDRWSDSSIFIGLLIWYSREGMQTQVALAGISLASSVLVSYTRARAEGVGAQCKRGLFTRLERFAVVIAGLVLNQMSIGLWVISVLSTWTALQRIYFTWKYIRENPE